MSLPIQNVKLYRLVFAVVVLFILCAVLIFSFYKWYRQPKLLQRSGQGYSSTVPMLSPKKLELSAISKIKVSYPSETYETTTSAKKNEK